MDGSITLVDLPSDVLYRIVRMYSSVTMMAALASTCKRLLAIVHRRVSVDFGGEVVEPFVSYLMLKTNDGMRTAAQTMLVRLAMRK